MFEDRLPLGFWEKKENQKWFFHWLGKRLGYKDLDDWYNVTTRDIIRHGGGGLLKGCYNGSVSQTMQGVYPEHNWMRWRFGRTPYIFWKKLKGDKTEITKLIDWIGQKLHVTHLDDWYRIPLHQIQQLSSVPLGS